MVYLHCKQKVSKMLYEEINSKIAIAMKKRDLQLLNTLKLMKSEIVKNEKNGVEINDSNVLKILSKMVSQREDSIKQYAKAKREDLVENERKEKEIIETFIPDTPSDDEIKDWTNKCIETYLLDKSGDYLLSMKDIKPVMTIVREKYPTISGKFVSQIITDIINK